MQAPITVEPFMTEAERAALLGEGSDDEAGKGEAEEA